MRPTSVTVSSATSSAWIPVNYRQNSFNVGIQVDVSAGATLTWVVETTSDNVFDSSVTPTAIVAAAPLDTGTGDETGNITIPVRAVRLRISAFTSGSAVMTVIQGN
jgi:hypothetical protein